MLLGHLQVLFDAKTQIPKIYSVNLEIHQFWPQRSVKSEFPIIILRTWKHTPVWAFKEPIGPQGSIEPNKFNETKTS